MSDVLVRTGDHRTSKDAADKVRSKLSKLQESVLQRFIEAGTRGLTDSELRHRMIAQGHKDGPESTYRKRRTDLCAKGFLEYADTTRSNDRGSNEKVWRVAREQFEMFS